MKGLPSVRVFHSEARTEFSELTHSTFKLVSLFNLAQEFPVSWLLVITGKGVTVPAPPSALETLL